MHTCASCLLGYVDDSFPMTHEALPPALPGDSVRFTGSAGGLCVYAAGQGAPLLLIHSINAAASAAEVRPLFDFYRESRRVYCLELPGFGRAERSDRPYDPRLMTDAVFDALRLIENAHGESPIDALALSLSCEYLTRAAVEKPSAFRSVALVSPTGFQGGASRRGAPGSSRGQAWLYAALRGPRRYRPGWGKTIFGWLTRPAVIRYFLRRTWGSAHIDETLWRYDILTARIPGAEFAPLRFLSGYLFSGDINVLYEALRVPTWVSHGVRGDFTNYEKRNEFQDRVNWRFTVFKTGALPFFEVPAEFLEEYDSFLRDPTARISSSG